MTNHLEKQMPLQCGIMLTNLYVKMTKKCKNEIDRNIVEALDAVPYHERQCELFLTRTTINTKQKLGLGVSKNGKKPSSENWQEKLADEGVSLSTISMK